MTIPEPQTESTEVLYGLNNSVDLSLYSFTWKINETASPSAVKTVDLVLKRLSHDAPPNLSEIPVFTWPKDLRCGLQLGEESGKGDIQTFLDMALREHENIATPIAVKLIMTNTSGYVAQSNIIRKRLHACSDVESVAEFLQPGGYISAFQTLDAPGAAKADLLARLQSLLAEGIAAVKVTSTDPNSPWNQLATLEQEVQTRVNLQFLMPSPIPRRRIGLVQCVDYRMSLELLLHLNVDLVVFDEPGTCMERDDGPLSYLRDSFHAVDLAPDEGFVQRLLAATRDQKLDGLTTRFDPLVEKVAQVAEMLGLPTLPSASIAIATNKYQTRLLCSQSKLNNAICIRNTQELVQRLKDSETPLRLSFPVVIKPTSGRGSYGVAKAANEGELLDSIEWAAGNTGFADTEVMIEPYCDGPEIDINLAMWDGEVLFHDVSDNAPTAGDLDKVTGSGRMDFQEGLFMYPSQLPTSEQDLVCEYMRDCILRMGFRTGVFHCEARIQNSAMHYVRDRETGIIDLELKPASETVSEPSVFLIEINARPPGYIGLYAAAWTHGVDLWGVHMLHCLGDENRFRALSVPFANGPKGDRAVVLIMPEKAGILQSEDPLPRLRHEKPELAASVPLCLNYFKKGDTVIPPDKTANCFTSVIVVESQNGRAALMRTVEEVKTEWKPVIE